MTLTQLPDDHAIAHLADLSRSMVSPEVALRRPLAELVEATLTATSTSRHAQRAYRTSIGLFLQFLDEHRGELVPQDVQELWRPFAVPAKEGRRTTWSFRAPCAVLRLVDASLLDHFWAFCRSTDDGLPNRTATAAVRLAAVKSFLAVALRDGVLTKEQADALGLRPYRKKQKRSQDPVGRRLTPEEVRRLRASIDTRWNKGRRDLALIDMMAYLALRREEVISLELDNFYQEGGRWWVRITGKGEKDRKLKLHDVAYKSLTAWLEPLGLQLGAGSGRFWFCVDRLNRINRNSVLDASMVGRLVAAYGAAAGLAPARGTHQLSAHDLRRTAARNAFENGASLLKVKEMLGHADIQTTVRYIGAFEDDTDTAVDYIRF